MDDHGSHPRNERRRPGYRPARRTEDRNQGWPKGKKKEGPAVDQHHGMHELKSTLERPGTRKFDPDSEAGQALAEWRAALVQDLGV